MLEFLKNAARTKNLAHGYLFYNGLRDEMKKTAFDFAEHLKTSQFDILYIIPDAGKKEISINQIKEIKKHLALSPYGGFYKFVIIDKAETMNKEAANALLKTLEEPQGNAILILIASAPDLLPKTILSRLQEIRFKSVSLNKIAKEFISEEHIGILKKPLNDAFKYIEAITKEKNETEISALLNSWLFWFREKLVHPAPKAAPFAEVASATKAESDDKQKTLEIIKEIQKSKDMISNSNANQRLVLENLILCINNY